MTLFDHLAAPPGGILAGQLLLFICSLFYLAWWIVAFRPDSSASAPGSATSGFLFMAALVTGLAAVYLLSSGINTLADHSTGFPVKCILLAAAAAFALLLPATAIGFARVVTSELLIIHLWAALEFSTVAVLQGAGHLGPGSASALTILVGLGFLVSLACYVLYYRLDPMAAYVSGMVPLAASTLIAAVLAGVLGFARGG